MASITQTDERLIGAGEFAQNDAQHVGVIGKLVIAGAVPRRGDLHGRQHAEAGGQGDGHGGAGGRGEFQRRTARVDGHAGEQERGGGRGHGKNAVLGADRAAAHIERRADHGFDVQQVERDGGAHDIGDGIGGAHFVEVDLLDGHLVDLRLGFPEFAEDADGGALGGFGQVRPLDHLDDGGEVAMGLGFLHRHAVLGGADAGALHLFEGHDGSGIERSDGVRDGGLIGAGIGQGAHQHVAANSRECVQIASNRHELSL